MLCLPQPHYYKGNNDRKRGINVSSPFCLSGKKEKIDLKTFFVKAGDIQKSIAAFEEKCNTGGDDATTEEEEEEEEKVKRLVEFREEINHKALETIKSKSYINPDNIAIIGDEMKNSNTRIFPPSFNGTLGSSETFDVDMISLSVDLSSKEAITKALPLLFTNLECTLPGQMHIQEFAVPICNSENGGRLSIHCSRSRQNEAKILLMELIRFHTKKAGVEVIIDVSKTSSR
jgi:hypothetical protein